jgi:drug/metabolite transporter (DMT)-like permease
LVEKKTFWLLMKRSFWFTLSSFLWIYALNRIRAGLMTVFDSTNAIWTMIFKVLFHGEKVSKNEIFLILFSFFGIILLVNPFEGSLSG